MKVLTPVVPRDYPLLQNCLYVGYGVNLRQKQKGEVHIYLKERNTHLLGLGRTRWGKTEFIKRGGCDDVEFGNSLFNIDPKGSYDWIEGIAYTAYRVGRLKELMIFDLLHPEISVRLNPLKGLKPEKIGQFFFRLAPQDGDRFFPDVARDIAYTVSLCLYAMGKEEINVYDIYSSSAVEDFGRLERKLQNYIPKTDKEKKLYQLYYNDALTKVRKIAKKDKNYWSKVNTSFEVSVSQIATGEIGRLMGKTYGNPLLEKLMNGEPIIFHAYLGVLDIGEDTGGMVARLLSGITHHVYGVYYTNNRKMKPPVAEYWDEASNVFYDGAQDKFNKAGGVNCYLHAFTQSLADPKKTIGEDLTKILQDNANLILFSVIDAETQKYFEEMFGYVRGYDIIWKKDDFDLVQVEKPLVPASAFARLWKGAFHAVIEARYYRGYSPLLNTPPVWLYPLPYPEDRIIEKVFGIDSKYATYDQIQYAREVANDFDLFIRENEKYNFFSGIVIDLRELEYYEEFVRKFYVQGAEVTGNEHETEPKQESEEAQSGKQTASSEEDSISLDDFLSPVESETGDRRQITSNEKQVTSNKRQETSNKLPVTRYSSPVTDTPSDEVAEALKEMIEKYGVNRIDKATKNLLMVFKMGDRVYFRESEAKKFLDTKNLPKASVKYKRIFGKKKIPTTDFYISYPAFKLDVEADDCNLIEKITERK